MIGDLIEVDAVLKMITTLEDNLKTKSMHRQDDIYEHRAINGSYGTLQDLKQMVTSFIKQQRN